ncbi:MAG: diguanylate cyclase, partial [Massilia sp.]
MHTLLALPYTPAKPPPPRAGNIVPLRPAFDQLGEVTLREHLLDIVARRQLSALLQPIVHIPSGTILGYEGLIRGPADSPLHSPLKLFEVARANGMSVSVEHLCRRV